MKKVQHSGYMKKSLILRGSDANVRNFFDNNALHKTQIEPFKTVTKKGSNYDNREQWEKGASSRNSFIAKWSKVFIILLGVLWESKPRMLSLFFQKKSNYAKSLHILR